MCIRDRVVDEPKQNRWATGKSQLARGRWATRRSQKRQIVEEDVARADNVL